MTLLLLGAGPGSAASSSTIERTILGINGASLSAAGSYYVPIGGQISATSTTLAYGQIQWPGTGTFRRLYVRMSANTWTTGVQVWLNINGSRTALTSGNIASGTTTASDLSNSVTVASGDLVTLEVELAAAGSGAAFIRNCTLQFERDGQIFTVLASHNSNPTATANLRYIRAIGGPLSNYNTEAEALAYALESCTLSNLQSYASDTGAAALTVTSRKNSGAGNMTNTHASATAGLVRDSTNSDTLAASDTFDVQRAATGGATRALTLASAKYVSGTAARTMLTSGGQLTTISAGTTGYASLIGGTALNSNNTTETNAAGTITCAGDLSSVSCYIQANASSATVTMQVMKNGSPTGNTQTITAGATGLFTITGTVSVVQGDLISLRFTGTTTGALTVYWAGALFTNTGA